MDHQIPEGFKPVNIESYDGTTDPAVWIEDYLLHIHMARGDDLHAIKYLPLKLKGPARHWLNSLPAESIGCWEDLEAAFLDNFQGTYVRPPDADDLSHIIQQPEESARQFWTWFLTKKNKIVNCVRPGQIYCIQCDEYRLVLWGAHVIRRSILFALPCPPIYLAGLAHFPVPWYF